MPRCKKKNKTGRIFTSERKQALKESDRGSYYNQQSFLEEDGQAKEPRGSSVTTISSVSAGKLALHDESDYSSSSSEE